VEELLTDKRLHPDQAASSGHQALMRAAAAGHAEVVEKLLADKRANPELRPDDCYGCTALMVGAEAGHAKVVEKLLADKRVNPNARSQNNETALMLAAQRGHKGVVEKLLADERVNPNAKSGSGKTALMFAAEKGHADVVQELIKAGAEVDIAQMLQVTSNEGLKQKIVATEELFKAVEENNVELLNESIKAEAYVDAVLGKYHCTPLVLAAEQGYAEIVKVLIEAGADVNVRDKEGKTALILAVEEDHANVVQKLIAMKYDVVDDSGNIIQPKIDLNAKYLGKTALMLAVEEVHEDVVRVLIENLPEDSRVKTLNKALGLAKDDSIKSLLQQHESNATPESVRVNAEVSGTGSGSLGASKNETSKGAPSYPKTQLALCLASAAAFTSGAYFLLAQSAVSTMMWGPVPVLYLALVGCAAVGALLAWGLTTAYKDGFNDVAHSFYNWLGIDQDGPDAITVGS
jgi:ankyrin repeat protein